MPAEQRILMHRACFLDALHACASFESLERNKGKAPLDPDQNELADEHYKNAGAEEGIPFDLNSGLPVPMVNGHILGTTDEKFALPPLSKEFEKRSKGNLIPKANMPALNASEIMGRELDIPDKDSHGDQSHVDLVSSTLGLEKEHKRKAKAMSKLKQTFDFANKQDFRDTAFIYNNDGIVSHLSYGLNAGCAGLITTAVNSSYGLLQLSSIMGAALSGMCGLVCTIAYIGEWSKGNAPSPIKVYETNGLKFPMRRVRKALDNVRKEIDTLPANDRQEALRNADKIEFSIYALRTRHAFNQAAANDSFRNRRRVYKDLKKLQSKAEELGLAEQEVKAILHDLRRAPGSVNFERTLKDQTAKDLKLLDEKFDDYKNAQRALLEGPK